MTSRHLSPNQAESGSGIRSGRGDPVSPEAVEQACKLIQEAEGLDQALGDMLIRSPSLKYSPHSAGQLQFHLAGQMIRALFPGNGFGKTTAAAQEAHAWCMHSNRWQETPRWPVIVLWWAQQYDQFEILKAQIDEEVIGNDAVWIASKHCYQYPDGSRWYVLSCDRSWSSVQGINPDLVVYDEQPKASIHREMLMRRRATRKTRYIIAATATKGITWMKGEVYDPWLHHHESLGLDESLAMQTQSHPTIWCWPKGGIADNPGADQGDIEHYESTRWSSEKEKKVRLHGGFEDWTGDPIFDESAIERLRAAAEGLQSLSRGTIDANPTGAA